MFDRYSARGQHLFRNLTRIFKIYKNGRIGLFAMTEFDKWLNKTLQDLNTDETVFGPYINGILTGDEEEQKEALSELLTGVTDDSSLEKLVEEILQKWSSNQEDAADDTAKGASNHEIDDVDTKLAKLLESNIKTSTAQRIYTDEERQLRSRILEDYGQVQVPDEEAEYDGTEGAGGGSGGGGGGGGLGELDPDLVKNTNVQDVQALRKERREQSKLESQMKKDKDKEDRERQKKQREEKKEKRKTVKQERRR